MSLSQKGLVSHDEISRFKIAYEAMQSGKILTQQQKELLQNVLGKLVDFVASDDVVYQKLSRDLTTQAEHKESSMETVLSENEKQLVDLDVKINGVKKQIRTSISGSQAEGHRQRLAFMEAERRSLFEKVHSEKPEQPNPFYAVEQLPPLDLSNATAD